MKKVILLVATIVAFNACFTSAQGGWTALKGSGKVITLKPNVIDFDKIETTIPCKMLIEVGKSKSLEIEIDDNLSNFLTIQEDDKEHKLTFKLDKKKLGKDSWIESSNIIVRVSMPEMSVFTQKSNGNAQIEGLFGRYFRAENFGNGDIILRGAKIGLCDIDSEGNGDVNAEGLQATNAKVSLRGNGQIRFNSTEIFEAELNGNGNIQHTGTGKASKIERVGNGRITNEKSIKTSQGSVDGSVEKIKLKFQNNSAIPRKVAFIFYEPSQNGRNSTVIKVLLPMANTSFRVEVGTRFYNADSNQVGTVMGGGKLNDKPLYTVNGDDNGKVIKIF